MHDLIEPDAEGDVYAGIRAREGLPAGDTDTDRLRRVLSELDALDAYAAGEEPQPSAEFDRLVGVAYAVERIRGVLSPAGERVGRD